MICAVFSHVNMMASHLWWDIQYCSDANSHSRGQHMRVRVIKANPSSRGKSLENLLDHVSICFFLSNSDINYSKIFVE